VRLVRHIGFDRQRFTSALADAPYKIIQALAAPRSDRHTRTLRRESQG
jgi:hypothetical protein